MQLSLAQLGALLNALSLVAAAPSEGCPFATRRTATSSQNQKETLLKRADNSPADAIGTCPTVSKFAGGGTRNENWWPCSLRLDVLRQFTKEVDPLGDDFDYKAAFNKLDYAAVKKDLVALLTDSQDWWPADFGNYGPFFMRMTWHSAGTYRAMDGRGGGGMGQQRFAPLNSWPDNVNLDKARRLLEPIKRKYGSNLSWADLILMAGNVGMESMGFPTIGFAGGRPDTWQSDESVYWGGETKWLTNDVRYGGSKDVLNRTLEEPLAAVVLGLIYVNPEGPDGKPDPMDSAKDIRETFSRMGMNDEETVALIAGGHSFGKTHGAAPGGDLGPVPEAASLEQVGLGWKSTFGTGSGEDAVGSGIEVVWTKDPVKWNPSAFLGSLWNNEWTLVKSPGGAWQFEASNATLSHPSPQSDKKRKPTMLVSDISLRTDPEYIKITKRWLENPKEFEDAFAKAWFKLLHRDMGPKSRYLGPEVPKESFIWQDPLPAPEAEKMNDDQVASLKAKILEAKIDVGKLVATAWSAADTYRNSDKRGGANGARIALEPQKSWPINAQLNDVVKSLSTVRDNYNKAGIGPQVSLADTIVLGGVAAVEKAAHDAGFKDVKVPFTPGRVDAKQDDTDIENVNHLEYPADGFLQYGKGNKASKTEAMLVDKAAQLTLTPPSLPSLLVVCARWTGILTSKAGQLTNDYFVNLLDMANTWTPSQDGELYTAKDAKSGSEKFTASRSDMIFASHPELRAIAEVYSGADGQERLVKNFVKVFDKVMNLDRFDVR
ncbi:heme peroxidase [Apiospora rasikravindrae]|uniref:Catalase-peroxidase n=1 Tax=Apiospora rasikravindrae TaxID=990691 RepID=A0ABR1U9V9_9PEZI